MDLQLSRRDVILCTAHHFSPKSHFPLKVSKMAEVSIILKQCVEMSIVQVVQNDGWKWVNIRNKYKWNSFRGAFQFGYLSSTFSPSWEVLSPAEEHTCVSVICVVFRSGTPQYVGKTEPAPAHPDFPRYFFPFSALIFERTHFQILSGLLLFNWKNYCRNGRSRILTLALIHRR